MEDLPFVESNRMPAARQSQRPVHITGLEFNGGNHSDVKTNFKPDTHLAGETNTNLTGKSTSTKSNSE